MTVAPEALIEAAREWFSDNANVKRQDATFAEFFAALRAQNLIYYQSELEQTRYAVNNAVPTDCPHFCANDGDDDYCSPLYRLREVTE